VSTWHHKNRRLRVVGVNKKSKPSPTIHQLAPKKQSEEEENRKVFIMSPTWHRQ
jgi:hypothetical protein